MKIRKGFVSNSSSSSFLIGIGKIVDTEKLEEFIKNIDKWDYRIVTVDEIINHDEKYDLYNVERSPQPNTNKPKVTAVVDSFNYSEVKLDVTNLKPTDTIFMLYHSSGDDSDFWNDSWEEYDYDIDLSFFDDKLVEGCTSPEKYGLADFTYSYGAGRNG